MTTDTIESDLNVDAKPVAAAPAADSAQTPLQLKVKLLHPLAQIPRYQTAGAACFDLHAVIESDEESPPGSGLNVPIGGSRQFRTGLGLEIPQGFVLLVYSRSGQGFKSGVRLSNGTGVIDSDYRGPLLVRLHNDGQLPFNVRNGDRIAQCLLMPAPQVEIVEVEELSETERGDGAFGSTGR